MEWLRMMPVAVVEVAYLVIHYLIHSYHPQHFGRD
jgi:hypothetical protein